MKSMSHSKIEELNHVRVDIKNGGKVIVLDTGAIIGPESAAMLQALHSRSIGGLEGHLKILAEKGPENFMSNFYVGYGHKSIGDCGTTSIFIEGVSMLAAKAIQDWPLYSGQESSTRYIDFQIQPFKNPIGTKEGEEILEDFRKFYIEAMEPMKSYIKTRFPINEGEKETTYNKAIAARAFDILRGFLPAGATTNLAWHTNLRQAADKIMTLRHHPLAEVRNTAEALEQALLLSFPNSFGHKRYEGTENYNAFWMKQDYYYHNKNSPEFSVTQNSVEVNLLSKEVLASRPEKTELPKYLAEAGNLRIEFTLDFGSFRDLQRHRSLIQRMPLLTTELGFEEWYLNELTPEIKQKAEIFLKEKSQQINKLGISQEEKQYYVPMGYKTANRLTGNLPALVYLAELRSGSTVHHTLRVKAQMLGNKLEELFGKHGLVVYVDQTKDRFDVKRGEQDIVLK